MEPGRWGEAGELRLVDLGNGERATVAGIEADHPAAKRLADLGFVPGAPVQMLHAGLNCIVLIYQTRLGLGRGLQRSITLTQVRAGRTLPSYLAIAGM